MNESLSNDTTVPCGSDDHTSSYDQPMRIGSIFIIFVVSALGTALPFLAQKCFSQNHDLLDMFYKLGVAFGTGVVLATAFIHMLPPAQSAFANPCIADYFTLAPEYPWCYLVAMMAVVVLHLIDFIVRCVLQGGKTKKEDNVPPKSNEPAETVNGDPDNAPPSTLNIHTHHQPGEAPKDCCDLQLQIDDLISKASSPAKKISFLILEVGISMHSILIGLTLGLTAEEFETLLVALCFHQFFEGIGLGSACITSNIDQLSARVGTLLWFSLSTPLGVAIGIGIHESLGSEEGDTPKSVIASGIMDAVSFGILLYVAMIELMTKQISLNDTLIASSVWKRVGTFISLYLGMLSMVIIGAYA